MRELTEAQREAIAPTRRPDAWRAFGTDSEIRTCFRRLWHVLVLLGLPARPRTEASGG